MDGPWVVRGSKVVNDGLKISVTPTQDANRQRDLYHLCDALNRIYLRDAAAPPPASEPPSRS